MNAQADNPISGLDLLRQPFPSHQISKLPKPTKRQTEEVRSDYKKGIRCNVCGGWHHPNVVHLDYVGHAALTDRLLACDPLWSWEPLAMNEAGLPAIDNSGGMWIRLTVCGHSRLGYGHADGKKGGDAVKEMIGDALRNAAMRFGAALDLWHKGDLHVDDETPDLDEAQGVEAAPELAPPSDHEIKDARGKLDGAPDLNQLKAEWEKLAPALRDCPAVVAAKDARKLALTSELDDEIPY